VACVLVHIEVEDDQPTPAALSALGDARRIASSLGATLYAAVIVQPRRDGDGRGDAAPGLVFDDDATAPTYTGGPPRRMSRMPTVPPVSARATTPPPGPAPIAELTDDDIPDALVDALGRTGADKVVLIAHAGPTPSLWASIGDALASACEELRPALVMFPSTPSAADVAPRLAARIGAAFAANVVVETGPRGEVVFSRRVYGGGYRRRLALDDLDRAAVVTVPPGHAPTRGSDAADVLVLDFGPDHDDRIEQLGAPEAIGEGGDVLDRARVIVTGGAGVSAEAWPLLARLAAALGGEVAATRTACERGLAPPTREIGLGARYVAPVLYVACGASGSAGHLGAVSPDAEIVAIDRDPKAPIFRAASYGLVGALEDLLPELLAELEGA